MINGSDARADSEDFQQAIQALFAVSFKAKFLAKKKLEKDYIVMPLEGLWWAEDMDDFANNKKENWKWTLMIMQPDFISRYFIEEAMQAAKAKENNPALAKLHLETYEEGPCAQIMHTGPYNEEHDNILKIHNLIKELGRTFDGQVQKHHEIYLSDFRKNSAREVKNGYPSTLCLNISLLPV
jgi:hypothetical protein